MPTQIAIITRSKFEFTQSIEQSLPESLRADQQWQTGRDAVIDDLDPIGRDSDFFNHEPLEIFRNGDQRCCSRNDLICRTPARFLPEIIFPMDRSDERDAGQPGHDPAIDDGTELVCVNQRHSFSSYQPEAVEKPPEVERS